MKSYNICLFSVWLISLSTMPSISIHVVANSKTLLFLWLSNIQFSSVAQLCPTIWDPMDCSMPGLPVHHQLPEFTHTHVHRVGDAIQPSHPLLSPSLPALNLSQHQSLFKWISSSHQVAKVLEFQLPHQSFQWTPRTDLAHCMNTTSFFIYSPISGHLCCCYILAIVNNAAMNIGMHTSFLVRGFASSG